MAAMLVGLMTNGMMMAWCALLTFVGLAGLLIWGIITKRSAKIGTKPPHIIWLVLVLFPLLMGGFPLVVFLIFTAMIAPLMAASMAIDIFSVPDAAVTAALVVLYLALASVRAIPFWIVTNRMNQRIGKKPPPKPLLVIPLVILALTALAVLVLAVWALIAASRSVWDLGRDLWALQNQA